ncbi:MAG: hypothetical protein ACYTF9_12215 [Planctomycetota bacterium]|jgi:hypothetical protein
MVAVWFTFFYQDIIAPAEGAHGEFLVLGMMPVAVIFAASAVTLVVVSLVTKPPAADHVDRFFLEARNA